MANAARAHLAERGADPRRMPLFAFGGAGPVHAYYLATILHLPAIIVPLGAGVGSTIGLLAAPLAFDVARSAYGRLDQLDWAYVNALLDEMVAEGRALLTRSGVPADAVAVERTAEMRYVGQGHEVAVPLPAGRFDTRRVVALAEAFRHAYTARYGRPGPDVPLEVMTWRVTCSGPSPDVDLAVPRVPGGAAHRGQRLAYFPEAGGFVPTPVFDRYALAPGAVVRGPAIVEERQSTLVVGPRGRARVDARLNIVVELVDA